MCNKHLSVGINIIFGIAFIAALITAGYYRSQYQEIKDLPPKEVIKEVKVESPEKDAQIAELTKHLEEMGKKGTAVAAKPAQTKPQQDDRRRGPRTSLQEMKVNDPEKYQKIMEHYTSMNERMTAGVADKMVFFNELDTANMTETELENHQKLLEKLAKMHEAAEKLDMDDPESIRNNMRTQWQNFREVNTLMKTERDYLLIDAGRKMGFDDKEAQLLKDYVNNAYEITSGRSFFGGRGGRSRASAPTHK